MKQPVYLDYAAATPLNKSVLTVMQPYFAKQFYNPSATYLPAQAVKKDLEKARASVAAMIGAYPAEIVFTAGATEANNLAIRGVIEQFPGSNVVVSAIEHESVLQPAKLYDTRLAPVSSEGLVDLSALEKLIDDKTVLVSVMYANNEVGTIQPLKKIAVILEQKRCARSNALPLYFHTDAAQAANYLDLHVSRLGVDLMSLNGGKIYGPKQSGALYVHHQVKLQSLIVGGGQERGLRAGTENIAGCIGFATALALAQTMRPIEVARLSSLQHLFFDLLKQKIPNMFVNGSRKQRLPNNVHITITGIDNERVLIQLGQAGILAAAGSACSASSGEPSHVLSAMGLGDIDARASLRFSLGRGTTEADIRQVVIALAQKKQPPSVKICPAVPEEHKDNAQ